jgi:Flp pilus assembly protein TadD
MKDAGAAVAVMPPPKDAGAAVAVAPAVKDAGAAEVAVAPAPKDAGAAVAVAPVAVKDAGTSLAVAPARPDAGTGAPTIGQSLETLLAEAKVAIAKQRWRSAMDSYRKALKESPESDEAKTGLGIALVMSETGYREAVPLLNAGVKTDPKNAQAWLALGLAYQNIGQDTQAKKPYSEYLKLQPKGPTSDEVRAALQAMK